MALPLKILCSSLSSLGVLHSQACFASRPLCPSAGILRCPSIAAWLIFHDTEITSVQLSLSLKLRILS